MATGSLFAFGASAEASPCSGGTTSAGGVTISDCGFESPSVANPGDQCHAFAYGPDGSPWTFQNYSGIAENNSCFTTVSPPVPEGSQAGFIQSANGSDGVISQELSGFKTGLGYVLTVAAANRDPEDQASYQDFNVLLDSQVIGHYQTTSTGFVDVPFSFTTTAGTHTLTFAGLNSDGNGDVTTLIDNVRLSLADVTAPLCGSLVVTRGTGPNGADQGSVTPTDAESGIASITNLKVSNGTASLAPLNSGDHSSKITITKTNPALKTVFRFDVTDVAGNVTHCS